MSKRLQALVLGLTNAFTPLDYTDLRSLGESSKRIDNKMNPQRKLTREKIDKIAKKAGQQEGFATISG